MNDTVVDFTESETINIGALLRDFSQADDFTGLIELHVRTKSCVVLMEVDEQIDKAVDITKVAVRLMGVAPVIFGQQVGFGDFHEQEIAIPGFITSHTEIMPGQVVLDITVKHPQLAY